MSGWLSRLLLGTGGVKPHRHNSKIDSSFDGVTGDTRNLPDAAKAFLSSIEGMDQNENPLLSKVYSPSSRVPCTDLIPFISECIERRDRESIISVMRSLIEGSPGIGVDSRWIDEKTDEVLSIDFGDYVTFKSPHGLKELQAYFIVSGKNGGRRQFLITEKTLRLISWSCIAHEPIWSPNLCSLADKANRWIDEMAEHTPFWKDFRRFEIEKYPNKYLPAELQGRIADLTVRFKME